MPSEITEAPIETPIDIESKVHGSFRFLTSAPWSLWFHKVVIALFRPQVALALNFPNTAAGASSDLPVTFNPGTVAIGDIPIVSPSAIPANSMFTAYVSAVDQVTVRFNNYSAGAINPASTNFVITVLKQ